MSETESKEEKQTMPSLGDYMNKLSSMGLFQELLKGDKEKTEKTCKESCEKDCCDNCSCGKEETDDEDSESDSEENVSEKSVETLTVARTGEMLYYAMSAHERLCKMLEMYMKTSM